VAKKKQSFRKSTSAAGSNSRRSKAASAKKPIAKRRPKPATSRRNEPDGKLRLQRVLALAGFGSRRECEVLITAGRVEVDGAVANELGTRVDPDTQKIFIDGEFVKLARRQYFMLNKPPGVLSTSKDPSGRARVIDLISTDQRVFTVGRLDKSSEGLILVTNDGDLANHLTHPKFGVEKIYHVHVAGNPSREDLETLQQGVYLADGFAKVEHVKVRSRKKNFTELEMVLDEGRNREIRRLLARIGHKVLRLKRVAIGPLRLGELPLGAHRRLTDKEVRELVDGSLNPQKRRKKPVRKKPTGKPTAQSSPSKKREESERPIRTKRKSSKRTTSESVSGTPRSADQDSRRRKSSKTSFKSASPRKGVKKKKASKKAAKKTATSGARRGAARIAKPTKKKRSRKRR